MLQTQFFQLGSEIDLPELSGHVLNGNPKFFVLGVYAGGMGICVHLKHISTENQYALKYVRPDFIGDKIALDRFNDELQVWLYASMCSLVAEALAVVRINETSCVLGPWMQKGDLAHALPNLSTQQKFEAVVRIVRGLSWVHENLSIIHRDLKPANILLDEASLAYVADWGLARPIGHAMSNVKASLSAGAFQRPDHTQAGSFIGTVTYAAPEQILGASNIDHRADIYALGCMMFEIETGSPPFQGESISEIARQHIHAIPPKIGGWFNRTEIGLENVITRCLQKQYTSRYSSYRELDDALVEIAQRRGFSLSRCTVDERYERSHLGKGHLQQSVILQTATVKGTSDHALVEFEDIAKFLEEADNLLALGKYHDAEVLLRPHFIAEFLNNPGAWHFGHSAALMYAYCLQSIDGRMKNALEIFHGLKDLEDKPAEFYVNYSLALLKATKVEAAREICEQGLDKFPNDLDIMGNHTIALRRCGDIDRAQESALNRIKLRRDVHSIEEAVGILQDQRSKKRDENLPEAVSIAKMQGNLIAEGLLLNPRFCSLRIAKIQLFRFAHHGVAAAKLCKAIIESDDCHPTYREVAFAEMIEELTAGKSFRTVFDLLESHAKNIKNTAVSGRLLALKMSILAEQYMIGKEDANGARIIIREVTDYYLTPEGGAFKDPVMAAKLLEWIGNADQALDTLNSFLDRSPRHWEGIKTMSLLLLRAERNSDALKYAERLTMIAPWRAESYDCLEYVAQQIERMELAQKVQKKGTYVFDQEQALFEDLRATLEGA